MNLLGLLMDNLKEMKASSPVAALQVMLCAIGYSLNVWLYF